MSRPHESPRFIALIAAVALLMTQIGMTREPARIGSLSATETKNLELLLRSELLTVLGREKTQPGESPAASLLRGVRVDRTSNLVIVELSKDYLPAGVANYSAELEDRLHRMTTGILWSIENELKLSAAGVSYIFDGQPLWFYYPEDFPDHKPNAKPPTKATHGKNTPIIVSAGHGAYLFYGTSPSTWRYQRDAAFGIREDTMTQLLTDELADLLITRSGATVGFVRDFSTTAHTPSGLPWSDVAARYFLADALPARPDIWNSLPAATHDLRERDEDIRARPFYANDVGAQALLSVHTNGDGSPTPRGARIYHATGRSGDQAIANSMLCYMKEIIQAQDGYEDFPVAAASHSSTGHGENNHAAVPAVIIETAFHSNPDDAAALQDPIFRTAAMKGVEKGYRLHMANESCTHYEIIDVPDVSAPWGGSAVVSIHYEGFPQYPVEVTIEDVACSVLCTPGGGMIASEWPSPIEVGFACHGDPDAPPGTAQWRVTFTDDDGVSTEFEYSSICGGSGSTASTRSKAAPAGRLIGPSQSLIPN